MMPRHPLLVRAVALSEAGRNPEAIVIINQLAAQGEPEAMVMLAEMKWRGGMVQQDLAGARELYRRAGESGQAAAGAVYTNLLASGIAGPRDWATAIERLRREAARDPRRRQALALVEAMKLTADGDPGALPAPEPLSEKPEARLFPRLFTAGECDYIRQAAEALYQPSFVNDASGRLVRDTIRTSDGSTIHWLIEDPAIHALNRRIAAATGTAADQGEALQVLRYRPGQQYRSHYDFVRASDNQRVLTALVYLNHDYKGGETLFVKAALKVKGRKGDMLLFRNAGADRAPDPMSEHAGLPVTSGTKYLATRWIRERRWSP